MAEVDENIGQSGEDVAPPPTDEEVVQAISFLTDAFDRMCSMDTETLSKVGIGRLRRMKRQIFNAMMFYCEQLPEPDKKPKPDEDEEE